MEEDYNNNMLSVSSSPTLDELLGKTKPLKLAEFDTGSVSSPSFMQNMGFGLNKGANMATAGGLGNAGTYTVPGTGEVIGLSSGALKSMQDAGTAGVDSTLMGDLGLDGLDMGNIMSGLGLAKGAFDIFSTLSGINTAKQGLQDKRDYNNRVLARIEAEDKVINEARDRNAASFSRKM